MKIWLFIWDGDGGTGARAFTTEEAAYKAFWDDAEASGYDPVHYTYDDVFELYCQSGKGIAWVEEAELESEAA